MRFSPEVEQRLQDWRDSLGELLNILEGKPSSQTMAELRANYNDMLAGYPMCGGVHVDEVALGSVPTTRVTPASDSTNAHLMYFHGGAYLFGAPRGYLGLASRLAVANTPSCTSEAS